MRRLPKPTHKCITGFNWLCTKVIGHYKAMPKKRRIQVKIGISVAISLLVVFSDGRLDWEKVKRLITEFLVIVPIDKLGDFAIFESGE